MKKIKAKASVTIFLIFLGVAVLEAVRTRNWIGPAFWLAVSAIFLIVGSMTREGQKIQTGQHMFH